MAEKDFIGFTFDDVHSDELGILRVSDGDRYKEDLQPEIKDLTAEVPGMHGEYYFGSTYGNKEFDIDIAYDSLTETQFRKLRRLFSGREIHELIFDERPYKKYLVKLANPIELSYACFDEPEKEEVPFDGVYGPTTVLRPTGRTQRTYKGDGTISFIAYYPFAKNVFKVLSLDTETQEWADSSGLLTEEVYNDFDEYTNLDSSKYGFRIYNPGDMDTGFRLYFPSEFIRDKEITLRYKINASDIEDFDELIFDGPTMKGIYFKTKDPSIVEGKSYYVYDSIKGYTLVETSKQSESELDEGLYYEFQPDVGIIIDTNSKLILGVLEEPAWSKGLVPTYITSQYVYNECIKKRNFFKFKPNLSTDDLNSVLEIETTPSNTSNNNNNSVEPQIFYDYLYF